MKDKAMYAQGQQDRMAAELALNKFSVSLDRKKEFIAKYKNILQPNIMDKYYKYWEKGWFITDKELEK